ncbi:MAG: hypothetical protein WBZ04_01630 [Candidatus Nanopelagicales bacterium]
MPVAFGRLLSDLSRSPIAGMARLSWLPATLGVTGVLASGLVAAGRTTRSWQA